MLIRVSLTGVTASGIWYYLSGGGQDTGEYTIEILKASLRDLGWRVNETIEIEERWTDGDASRLARLAGELIQLRPDLT